jgi:hypothetical protein
VFPYQHYGSWPFLKCKTNRQINTLVKEQHFTGINQKFGFPTMVLYIEVLNRYMSLSGGIAAIKFGCWYHHSVVGCFHLPTVPRRYLDTLYRNMSSLMITIRQQQTTILFTTMVLYIKLSNRYIIHM